MMEIRECQCVSGREEALDGEMESAEKSFLGIAKLVRPGKIKVRCVCLIAQEFIFGSVRIQLIWLLLFELGMV